jgi:hypothetical protein
MVHPVDLLLPSVQYEPIRSFLGRKRKKVKGYRTRLESLLLMYEFDNLINELIPDVSNYCAVVNEFNNNDVLPQLFTIILDIGKNKKITRERGEKNTWKRNGNIDGKEEN